MESYTLPTPAYPAELAEISFALFVDMVDAASLRQRLIEASTMEGEEGVEERKRVDFAFLDSRMVGCKANSTSDGLARANEEPLSGGIRPINCFYTDHATDCFKRPAACCCSSSYPRSRTRRATNADDPFGSHQQSESDE